MKYTVRTFIAVEIDDAVRRRVVELIGAYAATAAKVSWVQRQNLHLTLKFLDEVPLGAIPEVSAAVEKAAAAFHPFDLEIRAAGAFPSKRRPRTLWVGTGNGSDTLAALHAALENALKPLGFPKEHRRFAAHLTLGRVRGPNPAGTTSGLDALVPLIRQNSDFNAGRFRVAELIVFSSQLTPQGPIYEALARAPLS